MQKSIENSYQQDGRHSFLYWLVIPFILTWFAASYVLGSLTDKPQWLVSGPTVDAETSITPQILSYSTIPTSPAGYITLWFDDAWLSQYLVAFPMLQQYNFPGTIAVPAVAIEQPGYVNWAQLKVMQKSGWEITNHSVNHDCQMHNWTAEEIASEYRASKLALWKHQLASDILVTPCGVDSQVMRDEAAKVFLAYRIVDPGENDLSNLDPFNLKVRNIDNNTTIEDVQKWIDQAKQPNQWVILVFHLLGENSGSNDADKYNLEPAKMAQIFDYIKSTKIPVVVPSQIIAAYAK